MADIEFTMEPCQATYRTTAMRQAVLYRLTRREGTEGNPASAIDRCQRLLKMWRIRVEKLYHGPQLLRIMKGIGSGEVKYTFARNCRPSMIGVLPRDNGTYTRDCRLLTICPWCWARMVTGPVYDALTSAAAKLGLVYRRGKKDYPAYFHWFTASYPFAGDARKGLLSLLDGTAKLQRTLKADGGLGSLVQVTLQPGSSTAWEATLGAVSVAPLRPCGEARWRTVKVPRKKDLAAMTARVTAYPCGLLLHDDLNAVAAAVDARRRCRLRRGTGVFYDQDKSGAGATNTGSETEEGP